MFPSHGYVYTVQFSDDSVKVGMSESDPQGRVAAHRRTMAKAGLDVKAFWISKRISNPAGMETALLWHCSANCSARINREWFEGVDYKSLHEHIRTKERPFKKTAKALKIAMIMKEKGIDEIAEGSGIPVPKMRRMLSGKSCMTGKEMNDVCKFLDVDLIKFLKWGD